jgi:hypothetical protein
VQQRERAAHETVAQRGEPARFLLRQLRNIAAHGLDEEELGELGENRLAAGPRRGRFLRSRVQEAGKPGSAGPVAQRHAQNPRQCFQQGAA